MNQANWGKREEEETGKFTFPPESKLFPELNRSKNYAPCCRLTLRLYTILCSYSKQAFLSNVTHSKGNVQTKIWKQLLAFYVQMPKENANVLTCLSRNLPFVLYTHYDWLTFYCLLDSSSSDLKDFF